MKLRIPDELTDEQIKEFQRIYKKTYNEEISKEDARDQGLRMVRLIAVVLDESDNKKPHLKKED